MAGPQKVVEVGQSLHLGRLVVEIVVDRQQLGQQPCIVGNIGHKQHIHHKQRKDQHLLRSKQHTERHSRPQQLDYLPLELMELLDSSNLGW